MKIDKPHFATWLKAGLNEAFKPEDATNGKMDGRSGLEFELTVDDQKVAMISWVHFISFCKMRAGWSSLHSLKIQITNVTKVRSPLKWYIFIY